MKRLVAFGCSYTHGSCIGNTSMRTPPSDKAWPTVLARKMGRQVENCAQPGASQLQILWSILNFAFEPSDVCVIMWSHFNRSCIFAKSGLIQLDFGLPKRLEKNWLKTHTEYDHEIHNCINIHHAEQHLKALNIENFYHIFGGDTDDRQKMHPVTPVTNVIDVEFENIDHGSDGFHPGPLANALLAARVYDKIKNKDTL